MNGRAERTGVRQLWSDRRIGRADGRRRAGLWPIAPAALVLLLCPPRPAGGYVEVAYSLGRLVNESTNVLLMQVEKLDKQKNLIIYRKVQDIKGSHKGEVIKHDIGQRGFNPREWKTIMAWAEVGKTALFFHNGGAGEVCLKDYWYQCYGGDWWRMAAVSRRGRRQCRRL